MTTNQRGIDRESVKNNPSTKDDVYKVIGPDGKLKLETLSKEDAFAKNTEVRGMVFENDRLL